MGKELKAEEEEEAEDEDATTPCLAARASACLASERASSLRLASGTVRKGEDGGEDPDAEASRGPSSSSSRAPEAAASAERARRRRRVGGIEEKEKERKKNSNFWCLESDHQYFSISNFTTNSHRFR